MSDFNFPPTKELESIAKDAAHLVAAILDPAEGLDQASLPLEVRDTLTELLCRLRSAGLMEAYRLGSGGYGVWG